MALGSAPIMTNMFGDFLRSLFAPEEWSRTLNGVQFRSSLQDGIDLGMEMQFDPGGTDDTLYKIVRHRCFERHPIVT